MDRAKEFFTLLNQCAPGINKQRAISQYALKQTLNLRLLFHEPTFIICNT